MKRFFTFFLALLTMVGVANAAAVAPVSGELEAGVEYTIPGTGDSFDKYYVCSETLTAGQTIVVFYYSHEAGTLVKVPVYFGPKGDNPDDTKKTETDAAGNKVGRVIASASTLLNADGHPVIELYKPDNASATWCYVICSEDEAATVSIPEFGTTGGGDTKPTPVTIGNGASVKPNTVYNLPLQGEDGYVADNDVVMETPSTASQYIVVFLNKADVATNKTDFKNIFYGGPTRQTSYKVATNFETSQDGTFSYLRYYRNAAETKIDVYASDMKPNDYGTGWTWSYVIVDTEAEVTTVANPYDVGGFDGPTIVPGQDIENAIVLTKDVAANFKSTNKKVYVKFVAENSGEVTMTLSAESNYSRWMEDGVMAYGQLKQNMFKNGNQFTVEKGHTYYCLYEFASDVESTISYSLAVAEKGSARGEAILIEANGNQDLLGIAHIGSGTTATYYNKTTWFKLEKDGTLENNDLVTITIGGSNETEVALFVDDDTDANKSYAMGSGSGMLPKNSTVKFDIDLTQHNYYIAITQDDVNGTANFTFSVAQEGETMAKAFTAVEGENTVTTPGWYKYAHTGDTKLIKITGISKIVNENGGNIAEGDDVKIGFAIADGTNIYFEASASFTLSLETIEKGMTADDPVILTNETGAKFNLGTSVATDTQRFMQYTATEDGTFLYGTTNAKVIEFAVSATVRDVTNPDAPKAVSIVQEENTDFGETYFIYKWPVVAGHTYAIEQGLGNNFGTVEFLTMFTAAKDGETIGKAIGVNLYGAVDLGRKAATVKYYKFTAEEAGDYTLSVQMKGYVKSYDAEGVGSSIAQSYSDGLTYHNGAFTLAQGETLVFSCEPSETIEHIGVAIKDEFIPNYYATVTKADETGGLDYTQPMAIAIDDESSIADNNVWHGPIAVPAGKTLYVVANTEADVNAIYFAVETADGLQWLNKQTDLSVENGEGKQIFTIAPAVTDRNIQLLSYGMLCAGTFTATFTDPGTATSDPLTFYVEPDFAYNADTNELTVSFTVPQTYKDSETAVENLNLAAVSIKNETTGQSMEISTDAGDGAYTAGDTFSIKNTVTFDINDGDVLSVAITTWGQTNITIETKPFTYSSLDEDAYYIVITNGETQQKIKVSADVKLEWKKGSELKK